MGKGQDSCHGVACIRHRHHDDLPARGADRATLNSIFDTIFHCTHDPWTPFTLAPKCFLVSEATISHARFHLRYSEKGTVPTVHTYIPYSTLRVLLGLNRVAAIWRPLLSFGWKPPLDPYSGVSVHFEMSLCHVLRSDKCLKTSRTFSRFGLPEPSPRFSKPEKPEPRVFPREAAFRSTRTLPRAMSASEKNVDSKETRLSQTCCHCVPRLRGSDLAIDLGPAAG